MPAVGTGVVWVRVGVSEPQPAGFTVYVAPGSHEIELFARTSRAKKQSVQAVAGQVLTIRIPETPAPAPMPKTADRGTTPPPPNKAREFPTVLVALGSGLTLASAGVSVFLYTHQASKRDDAEAIARSDPEYAFLRDEHQDARTLYHVSLGVTGVFAAATTADPRPSRLRFCGFLTVTLAFAESEGFEPLVGF